MLAGPWLHENRSVRDLLAWNGRGVRMSFVVKPRAPKLPASAVVPFSISDCHLPPNPRVRRARRPQWCRMEQISNALSPKVKPVICATSVSSVKNYGPAEICGRLGGVTLDGTVLGKGGFGIVYRGTWEGHLAAESDGPRMDGNKTAVAVKRAPAGDEIRREAKLMGSLDHPHILKLLTSFDSAEDDSKHDSKHDAQAAEGTAAMATSSKWSSASGSR